MSVNFPTVKDYKALILSGIDNSGHNEQELKTDHEKIEFVAGVIRQSMKYRLQRGDAFASVCLDWLQGLAGACSVPFMNHDAVKWAEAVTGSSYTEKQADRFIENYWHFCAHALASMIDRLDRGFKSL